MRRKFPWWSLLGIVLVVAGIAAYNIWAYNCGYCAIQDMKTIGPQTRGVGLLVLAAGVFWIVLRFSRGAANNTKQCLCGRHPVSNWSYCPDCGADLK